ncbi:MAG: penicillin-binding protein, partial [Devosia sp.]
AVAWQKFMAYAHSNIEIKPVFGVDFIPEQTVIANADPAQLEEAPAERPPTLKPAAARKLVDMADLLQATLRAAVPVTDQASTPIPVATNGL